ncbi:MAG: DUF305 domain-containing protein [Angustibacter sp.]
MSTDLWRGRTPLLAVGVVAVMVALVAGLLAGSRLPADGSTGLPDDASVDAGFARDMQAHHNQAVEMAQLMISRAKDPQLRVLAWDILLTQQQQTGQMYGWLAGWGLTQGTSRTPMAWAQGAAGMSGMDHGGTSVSSGATPTGATARMPGMASDRDLRLLRNSTGLEAERRFLQLMIPHHQGGVVMARVAAAQAGQPQVRLLASTIVESQTAEIAALRELLTARGGPVPQGDR